MKIKLVSSSFVIAALCGSLHALAQSTTTDNGLRDRDEYKGNQLGKLERGNKIIGTEVKNSQDL